MTRRVVVSLLAGLLLAATGCAAVGGTSQPRRTELAVFAASSLNEVFHTLGKQFAERREGVTVTFSYGSSATLAQQIARGAPADVFAAASPATMRTVTGAALADGEPAVFVRNRLQIAVAAGNPENVRTLADLRRPGLTVAFCAREAPCGAAAEKAMKAADLRIEPDTYGRDVKAVLSMLLLGEVDAALIYHTDVVVAGAKVEGIGFPEAAEAINDYPIVAVKDAPHPKLAAEFVAFVRSGTGRAALSRAGFELP